MQVLYPRCAGLDVHSKLVVACVRLASGGQIQQEVREFGTNTRDLLELLDWLSAEAVTHVAMEATGVYWKPVWHVLEGHFELVLGNAAHMRGVPGRKSDVNDATWIADLLAHGLIRASFVPPLPVQQLRDLTRTRKQLVREIVQHTQRIEKTLEDANLKITGVITDLLGASGRAILQGLIAGKTDPQELLALSTGRLKAKRSELVEALRGRVTKHHRFLLQLHLEQIETLQKAVGRVESYIGEELAPFRAAAELLSTMPGISEISAEAIVAEIGLDMARFPTAGHLLSWACLCPRLEQSAGKRKSNRTRKGNPWLKTMLVQAAWAAVKKKDSYLRVQFLRLKGRRGPKKAIVAVASSMLTAIYHMLRDHVPYRELGPDYLQQRDKDKLAERLIRKLQRLGVEVEVRPTAA